MSTKTLEGVLNNTNEYKTQFQEDEGEIITKYIDLSLTNLHYTKYGSGPPLIMVPATMSHIKDWITLIQFMGQKFTTYFFELPGYGGSTPYKEKFSSKLVTKTIESFATKLKIDNFSIMGFSFGGILTLKAVDYLEDRINKVILLSPCVSKKAMNFSTLRSITARGLAYSLKNNLFRKLISNKKFGTSLLSYLRKFGKIDIPIEEHLKEMPKHTLDILVYQINEILNFEIKRDAPFKNDCHLAMSTKDPLLNFKKTKSVIEKTFKKYYVYKFDHPYHQLTEKPTLEWLNKEFGWLLESFSN